MSDDEALLAAIAAHPEEDTPRLVYADWLDEHGQPVRAEFIRVQVAIAQKDHLPRAILNRHVDLFKRNQELIDNHRAELLGPLAGLSTGRDGARVEFRRGFLTSVDLHAVQFVMFADAVSALRPLPEVTVRDAAVHLDALSEVSHHLALVTALHMQSQRRPHAINLTPAEVWNVFVECWPWDRLRELNLEECRIGDEGMERLAASQSLSLLTDLDVSGNHLSDAGVGALLDSSLPPQLRRLILGGNPITDEGAIALAERWPTGDDDRLENLNLRFTNIGQAGHQALLRRFGGRVDLF
jgi:uncharacterized protein (TIGR02996 family)